MTEKKTDKKQDKAELTDEQLKDVAGGFALAGSDQVSVLIDHDHLTVNETQGVLIDHDHLVADEKLGVIIDNDH